MMEEVLSFLKPMAGKRYVDGTIGLAGHALAILESSAPDGWLFGCDRDGAAIERANKRLIAYEPRYKLQQTNYSEIGDCLEPGTIDGVLLDLGVSSPQLDDRDRGFSFMNDGSLDMRMNQSQTLDAAQVVAQASADELSRIFWVYGDERRSRSIARAIVGARNITPIVRTKQLVNVIESVSPRRGKTHPATRVFQALRIHVNEEFESLTKGLEGALNLLKTGGRLVVISFHSGEDRIVKDFGRRLSRDYEVTGEVDRPEFRRVRDPILSRITRKPIAPKPGEVARNPRARSAKIRVFEKN
jgi:16S rRNA (cytosine1402-N4)-methyltransferase